MWQSRIILGGVIFAVLLFSCPALAAEGVASAAQGNSGNLEWSVYGQTGFQRMNLEYNASFPTGPFGVELAHPSPLDIKLGNVNLWMGGIGADITKGPLSGFLDLKASLPRNIDTKTPSEPFYGISLPVDWQGSHLKWWDVSIGAGIDITPHITIQAGFNWDHLSLSMRNPVDPIGVIPAFESFYGDNYSGSLKSNLFIPWVGVKVTEERLKGSLRFSPLAYTDLNVPFNYKFVVIPHSDAVVALENERYTFRHNGIWFEGNLAYDIYKIKNWCFSLWTNASWLRTNGTTGSTYRLDQYNNGTMTSTILTDASSGSGSYHVSTYAFGVRVAY